MSVWKSDETLLSICILNFSFKNDFVWEEISNIRHSVSSPDETPRSSSKILRYASYFQLSSLVMKHCISCLIYYMNASVDWYWEPKTRLLCGETGRVTRQARNRRTNGRRFFRAVHLIFLFFNFFLFKKFQPFISKMKSLYSCFPLGRWTSNWKYKFLIKSNLWSIINALFWLSYY